ncbi:MAG TPA: SDR family NAD(P)-dependent oxidoreductase [Luteolibacter sp.]|nr:SDR family NAD(P)-dependent oxidoreductase [Luteolibacter sp.]
MPTPDYFSCAVITGASAGLGEEYALQLAPVSNHLVLVARRAGLLENLADRIRTEFPKTAVSVIAADLSDAGERRKVAATLQETGLRPDLLVNNAGLGDYGEFATAEWPRIEAMLRVNIEALTHLTHLLLPAMPYGGAVLNVSSLASLLPIPDFAVYAATKAYVTSFSEALRIELRASGIRVLAVCPGPVHTEFGTVARRDETMPGMRTHPWFYVPSEQVVAESLRALTAGRARVFPGLRIAAAALVISAIPIVLMRTIMERRPRKC